MTCTNADRFRFFKRAVCDVMLAASRFARAVERHPVVYSMRRESP